MSIHQSFSCKKLRKGEEEKTRNKGLTGGYLYDHHVQNLLVESMMRSFFTNIVFCFAGEKSTSMLYSLMNIQLVVLVQCTHSNAGKLEVGKNIESRLSTRFALFRCE